MTTSTANAMERSTCWERDQQTGICDRSQDSEVDQATAGSRDPNATPKVREVHPEICFWALNERQPMEHSEKEERRERRNASKFLTKERATYKAYYNEACRTFPRKPRRQGRHSRCSGGGGDGAVWFRATQDYPRMSADRLQGASDGDGVLGGVGRRVSVLTPALSMASRRL